MKKKCNECGSEIKDGGTKKLMQGPNGYRLYEVCKKHVEMVEQAPAGDVLGRAGLKASPRQAHHLGVTRKTIKKLAQAVEAL